MKRILSYLIAVMLVSTVMISCNSGPGKKLKEAKEKVQTTSRAVKGMSKMEKESDDIGKRVEALSKQAPFTNDKFKKWMPEQINGMKRTSFEFTSTMGNQGRMSYEDEIDNNKKIKVSVIDGAGEMGSVIYASQAFLTGFMDNYETESESKTEKIVERKGKKAMETFYKKDNKCEIKTVVDDRFIVIVESDGMSIDETWNAIDKLNVGKLK